jgi:excisionase family DNA binding protein
MNDTLVYTVRDVTKILHCSPNYVYKLIDKGFLPAFKLGSLKILGKSLEKFLIENQGKDLSDLDNIRDLNIDNKGDEDESSLCS